MDCGFAMVCAVLKDCHQIARRFPRLAGFRSVFYVNMNSYFEKGDAVNG
jgi:hypothetical protein